MMAGSRPTLSALVLWMHFCSVAALTEPEVCYLLDGILFFYGIILTVLYFRIRRQQMSRSNAQTPPIKGKKPAEEGVYTGLASHTQDTYETVGMKKNPNM
ncbi:high affinity immunoglobulin epsilon receptor subunit gamma isoform X1 [Gadus macrocephalus]|uniref:high affinity immunoglobulin epsilon receptor subunit gamma isoform X1 n=1 Tax=Gadus macrocephalus TaxID=80720 RepID=UPI0028CB786B|nr:high affinity immunoglobulin epsilon receptor subunit gamma isoform X1 [Gadus macrocephalus]